LAGMKPINIEILMNHSTGISDSYYRATENELLKDYLKAIEDLTINNFPLKLKKQMRELADKDKENEYVIKSKLADREHDIRVLREQETINTETISNLSDQILEIKKDMKLMSRSLFKD